MLGLLITAEDMSAVTEIYFEIGRTLGNVEPSISGVVLLDYIGFTDNRVSSFEHEISEWTAEEYSTISSELLYYKPGKAVYALKCTSEPRYAAEGTKSIIAREFLKPVDIHEYNGITMWVTNKAYDICIAAAIQTDDGFIFETRPVDIPVNNMRQYVSFFWGQFFRDKYCPLVLPCLTEVTLNVLETVELTFDN